MQCLFERGSGTCQTSHLGRAWLGVEARVPCFPTVKEALKLLCRSQVLLPRLHHMNNPPGRSPVYLAFSFLPPFSSMWHPTDNLLLVPKATADKLAHTRPQWLQFAKHDYTAANGNGINATYHGFKCGWLSSSIILPQACPFNLEVGVVKRVMCV